MLIPSSFILKSKKDTHTPLHSSVIEISWVNMEDVTLSGNSLAMAEKLPVRNIEFPQASNIRIVNAKPRKSFPFWSKPRQP